MLHGSPLGHRHLTPPKPLAGVGRSDALWHSGGYGYYWYGRDQHYFGQFYQGPLDWDAGQGAAYPFPYLFPDYYPGDWLYSPPCGVWVIQTWFSGNMVTAYFDPYLGGYYTWLPDWGYVNVTPTDEDVCAIGGQ